jgi:5-methylthioadenosine/S-adenosylhomocysteine deaminase
LAHCVHLTETEIERLAEFGCHIAHCPTSNLKLASGIAPVASCLKKGINVGLGTDGAASNNRLDMFAEMRLAALLAKASANDATAIPACQALEMATINGAKALGLDQTIGSIEMGKLADLVAVKLEDFNLQPCFDPVSHLVYVAGRENVSHVWVGGKLQYHQPETKQGMFNHVEPRELSETARKWQDKLQHFKGV